jgi:hypothetical protein
MLTCEEEDKVMQEPEKDDTPFGRWGDHCPWCAADWKAPHRDECERPEVQVPDLFASSYGNRYPI